MKTVLLLCALCLSFAAVGQTAPLPTLPTDSATHKITYQGVVQVPGVSADELYSRAREWFAVTFNSGKAVLDMDDRVAGKLIGNGYSTYYQTTLFLAGEYQLWRSVKVYVKDGRYRYELTGFTVSGPYNMTGVSAALVAQKIPVENYLGEQARGNSFFYDRKGNPKATTRAIAEAVDKSATDEAASLSSSMSAGRSAKKEW